MTIKQKFDKEMWKIKAQLASACEEIVTLRKRHTWVYIQDMENEIDKLERLLVMAKDGFAKIIRVIQSDTPGKVDVIKVAEDYIATISEALNTKNRDDK